MYCCDNCSICPQPRDCGFLPAPDRDEPDHAISEDRPLGFISPQGGAGGAVLGLEGSVAARSPELTPMRRDRLGRSDPIEGNTQRVPAM